MLIKVVSENPVKDTQAQSEFKTQLYEFVSMPPPCTRQASGGKQNARHLGEQKLRRLLRVSPQQYKRLKQSLGLGTLTSRA